MTIDQLIKKHGMWTLAKNGWHITKTAEELGVCVRTLNAYIHKWRDEGTHIPFHSVENRRRYEAARKTKVISTEGLKTLRMDE